MPFLEEGGQMLVRKDSRGPPENTLQKWSQIRDCQQPLPLRLCTSRYKTCQKGKGWLWEATSWKLLHARPWAGHCGGRAEKDAVCVLKEQRRETHGYS